MSLTSLLKEANSPVLAFMRESFPYTDTVVRPASKALRAATTIRPRGSVPYDIVGMAFDYRLRYAFAITPCEQLTAWYGAQELAPFVLPGSGIQVIGGDLPVLEQGATEGFFVALEAALATINPVGRRLTREEEELLARYCIVLALFETVYRIGEVEHLRALIPHPRATPAELLAIADDAWVDDLCALADTLHDHLDDLTGENLILNPTFEGSRDVGGADADLIVDGCLLDIKATINPHFEVRWLYQLLGYVLLDYSDRYAIRSVGIYYARQGVTLRWSLDLLFWLLTGDVPSSLAHYRSGFAALFEEDRERERKRRERRKVVVPPPVFPSSRAELRRRWEEDRLRTEANVVRDGSGRTMRLARMTLEDLRALVDRHHYGERHMRWYRALAAWLEETNTASVAEFEHWLIERNKGRRVIPRTVPNSEGFVLATDQYREGVTAMKPQISASSLKIKTDATE